MVVATIIERKLKSTKVRLFTVPCCAIIPVSSERWEKPYSQLTPNFFVVLSFLFVFYNCVFPRMSHIYQFCSIITCSMVKFAVIPFYNSSFYVHSSGVPERYIRYHKMMHIYASNLQDPSNLHVAGGFNGKLTSTN